MIANQTTPPTSECVSLDELKNHLKIDSGTLAEALTESLSISPGSHNVVVGYTVIGSTVEMTSDTALVMVQSGVNGIGGTVDIKIQDSADDIVWADWTGGEFDQIDETNDGVVYGKEYTGGKDYIRTVASVLVAASTFGTTVVQYAPTSAEDDLLTTVLSAAVGRIEDLTSRQLMTATWEYKIQDWPAGDRIKLPFGNLVSVTSVIWKGSDGTETTLTVTTDYIVETNGEACGYIVLPYAVSWPSGTLYPSNPITITFICGYPSAAVVPEKIQVAIKFEAQNIWRHGGEEESLSKLVKLLTYNGRLHDTF